MNLLILPDELIRKIIFYLEINEIYNSALKHGAEGGKLLGAGGGGFFLVYLMVGRLKSVYKLSS